MRASPTRLFHRVLSRYMTIAGVCELHFVPPVILAFSDSQGNQQYYTTIIFLHCHGKSNLYGKRNGTLYLFSSL